MDVYSILIPTVIVAAVVLVVAVPILLVMGVVDGVRALRRRNGR